jgi:hypothetical protein
MMAPPYSVPRPIAPSQPPVGRLLKDLAFVGSILVFGVLANDWIASAGLAVLYVGLRILFRQQGPPIVALAFANQWLQVMAGIVWFAISGRKVMEMQTPTYRPMVMIGLVCVFVLFAGFYISSGIGTKTLKRVREGKPLPWTTNQIAATYAASVAVSGILTELAWSTAGLTQAILVFSRVRYVLLFLLITRLVRPNPKWLWILGALGLELTIGFAGFFADFREPLIIAAIAVFGAMDRRKARTWVVLGCLALLAISSALIWTAIKPIIRKNYVSYATRSERLNAVLTVTAGTFARTPDIWKYEGDSMVSRIWSVYFPGLALTRVPSVIPFENGAILKGAIQNVITPRLFFPNKPILPSQSDEVRKYSGIWVGGRETNTSYAFGYAGESYVDFGIPYMFVPILVFGLLFGYAYRYLNRKLRHEELRTGVLIVIVWSTLGVYEASWVMLIGPTITILFLLGGSAIFLDRVLTSAEKRAAPIIRRPSAVKQGSTVRVATTNPPRLSAGD